MSRYDIAIIGSGPAALSAAINAKIRNKSIIVFGARNLSNKLIKAPKIDNYLGIKDVSGTELMESFKEHIESLGIEIEYKRINNIYAMGEYFAIMSGQEMFEASSVILATGVEFTKPMKGEEEFLGKGVGYCATCDAPLYRGKTVAVVGYNTDAEEEANYLSEIASKVYYIPMYNMEKTNGSGNLVPEIEVVNEKPTEIIGNDKAEKLVLKERELEVDGIFVMKDSVSPGELVPGLETEGPHIKVDREMKTNIEGCFAAGDCVGKPYQYMKSAGEGQVAALNAVSYLDKKKHSAK